MAEYSNSLALGQTLTEARAGEDGQKVAGKQSQGGHKDSCKRGIRLSLTLILFGARAGQDGQQVEGKPGTGGHKSRAAGGT